jgi:putative colanic acid biosynthesis UDP-glucose lipid carrier transferase
MSQLEPQKRPARPESTFDLRRHPAEHTPAATRTAEVEPRAFPALSQRILCDLVSIVDFLAILLSARLVVLIADGNGVPGAADGHRLLLLAPVIGIASVLAFRASGLYELRTLVRVSHQASRLLVVWVVLSIVASASVLGLYNGPVYLIAAWLCFAPAILISARAGLALGFRTLLDQGPLARRAAVVGAASNLARGVRVIGEDRLCSLAGVFELPNPSSAAGVDEILAAVKAGQFDDVIVLVPTLEENGFERLVQALSTLPLRVCLLPTAGLFDLTHIDPGVAQAVSVIVSDKPVRGWSIAFKSAVDYVGAVALLTVACIPMLIIAAAIRLESDGPAIFRQHRTGRSGRVFTLYKFRSMYVCEDGPRIRQAERNDPRVTYVGRIIRKFSLDELPQLFNVLRGEMSLVGPRPHAVAHDTYYGLLVPRYWERFRVKPGITGWAQVNGFRGETRTIDEMAERIQFDVEYANEYNIWRDLLIVLMTPYSLIVRHNKAY